MYTQHTHATWHTHALASDSTWRAGTVIALVKDVPDVAGDARYGIRSFSVRVGQARVLSPHLAAPRRISHGFFLGQARVLSLATALLGATLAAAAAALGVASASAAGGGAWLASARRAAVAVAAVCAARAVARESAAVEPTDGPSVYAFYMRLWKLFYASYACLPFAR